MDLSKLDLSQFDLSHLHPGERNRIKARQFTARELSALLINQNPWTKSGKPEPLRLSLEPTEQSNQAQQQEEIHEPTEDEITQLMFADDLQTYHSRDTPAAVKNELREFYRAQHKKGQEQERDKRRREQEKTETALDALRELREKFGDDPDKAHLFPPAEISTADLHKWYDEISRPVRNIPFPNPSFEQLRRDRILRDIQATGRPDPNDVAEEEAEADRYQQKLALAREKKRKELEAKFEPVAPQPSGVVPLHLQRDDLMGKELSHHDLSPKPSLQEKFWMLTDSNLFWGGGIGLAGLAYSFEWAKMPAKLTITMTAVSWLIICVSLYRHQFFEMWPRIGQIVANILLFLSIAVILIFLWIICRP
jgi:hypothetical protein